MSKHVRAATGLRSAARIRFGRSSRRNRRRDRHDGRGSQRPGFAWVVELNGARSNPRVGVELSRLDALHDELLRRALLNPREPRPVPAKVSPVLETVTLVLERSERPMRVREIHAAAEYLAGEPLLWNSVKSALAACAVGNEACFERV